MIEIPVGATDVTTYFYFTDPVTGAAKTGVVFGNVGLAYVRERCTSVQNVAVALGGVAAAHLDNGFFEVSAANCPGLYRIDWPDAVFAVGTTEDGGSAVQVRRVSLYIEDTTVGVFESDPRSADVVLTTRVADILAGNVDSTGVGLELDKALELLVAYAMGNAEYDPTTRRWTIHGRDGTTAISYITEDGGGNRSGSTIP